MINQNTPLMQDKKIDLVALKEACAEAKKLAIEASGFVADTGSCNLDATVLRLSKGERSAKAINAIESSGLRACKTNWMGSGVMIFPPPVGQANKNSTANEKIYYHLKDRGFSVSIYYQMD